jgi:hypothetical protein
MRSSVTRSQRRAKKASPRSSGTARSRAKPRDGADFREGVLGGGPGGDGTWSPIAPELASTAGRVRYILTANDTGRVGLLAC